MVSQSSQRTLAQPTRPADPARSFNERSHGIMRKIHTLTAALSDFDVEIALLIKTPMVEFTYESKDDLLRSFNTDLPEKNRFRPQDVENLFRGRVLECPSINSMSPLRGRSGFSSPTPSTSSAASTSSIALPPTTGLFLPVSPPTHPAGQNTTLLSAIPTSMSPLDESLLFPNQPLSPISMSDFIPPRSPAMDISSLLSWPEANEVPSPDNTAHRLLPSSPPTRATTPTPSGRGRSRTKSPYRVLKIQPTPGHRRKWIH
ncbi:hypothetical protein B0H66DRAFT_608737 [Apodospora peruviana]|uniref:Uncharacterized protein n=1 Tax=Apodospora peruviana TaxID=516989 RepID=A0AAE0HT71_9PEZI|nr:hypothetical protein B0H66DRAFT_608737 [Apodospora peruviana]